MFDQESSQEGQSGEHRIPGIETQKGKTPACDGKGRKDQPDGVPDPIEDPPHH